MGNEQILIVEDDAIIAMDIENQLKSLGYGVTAKVAYGEDAIKEIKEKTPDLVLMDIVLKGEMDGIEGADKIRSQFDIPVVFLTAYADRKRLERAKLTTPFGFIVKPFQDKDFRVTIEMALYTAKADAERKQAEEALRESEDRYRALFEYNPAATIIVDNKAKITMYNYAKENSGERLPNIGDVMYKEYAGKHQINMFEELMECIRSGDQKEFLDLKYEERFLNIRISPFSGGAIITSTDVTGRKNLEAQLRQSHKMEAIGTLASGITHEFNNILGIIMGNTELAIDYVPELNPAKDCLEEIRSASLRAKDVVRHILNFTRKSHIEKKPLPMSSIIRDTFKLLRASLPSTIDIRQDISCEHDTVLADPTQINQALFNICSNAAHAMQEEGGVLDVRLEDAILDEKAVTLYEDLLPGNHVKLTVKDTGHGIKPEVIDRIFDPYFTTKGVEEGTGMGLSVVHGIVKSHEGAVTVHSELGKGTVIEVLLPIIEAEIEPEVVEPKDLPTRNEKILFVDDEESLVNMSKQRLERLGYQVETKTNPDEALELFRSNQDEFDLVISDMTMPRMTGDKLAKKLMEIRPDIPIIISTGFNEKMDEDKAKEMGIRAFVMKPYAMRTLAVTVRKVLGENND